MSESQFQQYALDILQKEFPNEKFRKNEDAKTIQAEKMVINLSNLYQKYELGDTSVNMELIETHKQIASNKSLNGTISWQDAKGKLRPKINPRKNLEAEPKLLHSELTTNLVLAYALDLGTLDQYVTTKELSHWGKSQKEIHTISFQNLEAISQGIWFESTGKDIITLTTNDTYDSARVLLPGLQKKLSEKLGADFRIGLPNRDFVIFWSRRLDPPTAKKLENQISDNFKKMPYPLSEKVFVIKESKLSEL